MRLTSLLALVGIVVLPLAAGAQSAPPDVPTGTRIFVTPAAGGPALEGSLLSLSADSVALLVDGNTRIVPLTSVKRVEREGDPTSDGIQKGALVLGLACFLICGQGVDSSNELAGVMVAAQPALNACRGCLAGVCRAADTEGNHPHLRGTGRQRR